MRGSRCRRICVAAGKALPAVALLLSYQASAELIIADRVELMNRWGWNESASVAAPPVIRIGTPLTLDSGLRFSAMSIILKRSYELFFNWLNDEKGGIVIGGVRHIVELTLINDASVETGAAWATSRLIDHFGVHLLLGPYSSTLSSPAAAVAHGHGATMILPTAGSTQVYIDRPTVFGILGPADQWLLSSFDMLARRGRPPLSVAYINEDNTFCRSACSRVSEFAAAHNMTMVFGGTIPNNPTAAEVHGAVGKFTGMNPDVVIGCVYASACHHLIHSSKQHGLNPQALISFTCVTNSDFLDLAGDEGQYVFGVTPWTDHMRFNSTMATWDTQSFTERYREAWGARPPYQAASAFVASALLVHAIETANTSDPAAVAAVLREMNEWTVFGRISFNGNGQSDAPSKVVQHQSSERPLLVAPQDVQERAAVVPKPTWTQLHCYDLRPGTIGLWGFQPGSSNCSRCHAGQVSRVVPVGPANASEREQRRLCLDCPPGTSMLQAGDLVLCRACARGAFAGRPAASTCNPCAPGRFQDGEGQTTCKECPAGKFVSVPGASACLSCGLFPRQDGTVAFSASRGSRQCLLCPQGAVCERDADGLFSGYTNANGWYLLPPDEPISEVVGDGSRLVLGRLYSCPYGQGEACRSHGRCYRDAQTGEAAMEGPMCGVCRPGYAKAVSNGLCHACLGVGAAFFLSCVNVLFLLFSTGVLFALARYRDPSKVVAMRSVLLKILISYGQLCTVLFRVLRTSAVWDSLGEMLQPLYYTTGSNGMESSFLATSCLLQHLAPGAAAHHANLVMGFLMAPLYILGSTLAFGAWDRVCQRRGWSRPATSALVTGVVINLFIIHPRITALNLLVFECEYFDVPRLLIKPDVLCDSAGHTAWQGLGLVGFFIFSCGIPLASRALLYYYNRKNLLYSPDVVRMLGFLYRGYEPRYYWFESLLMCRKVLFQFIVLIPGLSSVEAVEKSSVQCTALLILSLVFLVVHLRCLPYEKRNFCLLDRCETAMLQAILVTCLLQTWAFIMDHSWMFRSNAFARAVRDVACAAVVAALHARFLGLVLWGFVGSSVQARLARTRWGARLFRAGTVEVLPRALVVKDLSEEERDFFLQAVSGLARLQLARGNGIFNYDEFIALLVHMCSNASDFTRMSKLAEEDPLLRPIGQLRRLLGLLPPCLSNSWFVRRVMARTNEYFASAKSKPFTRGLTTALSLFRGEEHQVESMSFEETRRKTVGSSDLTANALCLGMMKNWLQFSTGQLPAAKEWSPACSSGDNSDISVHTVSSAEPSTGIDLEEEAQIVREAQHCEELRKAIDIREASLLGLRQRLAQLECANYRSGDMIQRKGNGWLKQPPAQPVPDLHMPGETTPYT